MEKSWWMGVGRKNQQGTSDRRPGGRSDSLNPPFGKTDRYKWAKKATRRFCMSFNFRSGQSKHFPSKQLPPQQDRSYLEQAICGWTGKIRFRLHYRHFLTTWMELGGCGGLFMCNSWKARLTWVVGLIRCNSINVSETKFGIERVGYWFFPYTGTKKWNPKWGGKQLCSPLCRRGKKHLQLLLRHNIILPPKQPSNDQMTKPLADV